jgi:hypothetical protein
MANGRLQKTMLMKRALLVFSRVCTLKSWSAWKLSDRVMLLSTHVVHWVLQLAAMAYLNQLSLSSVDGFGAHAPM